MIRRRYPVGIQTFSEIIRNHYVYVDKTDLMWHMQDGRKYIFLSRPRRFGKSLLSSTLHAFFAGEKELFAGLKIMELEEAWEQYPVIHLDLSVAKNQTSVQAMCDRIFLMMKPYGELYGEDPDEKTPGGRITGLIQRAYRHTGRQVVVIIDEYDAPLLDMLHDDATLEQARIALQEFFVPLKVCEPLIKFCFITGITKFSQLSIFSTINNLTNISMWPRFSAICGITEQELTTAMSQDIAQLAEANACTPQEMHEILKNQYDGYHFSERSEEVYNPYSLLKAFDSQQVGFYWFDSGTPKFLISEMKRFHTDVTTMDRIEVPVTAFDKSTEEMEDALPLLYQTGYLTIKHYDKQAQTYVLSIPNTEVRVGFTRGLLPSYVGLGDTAVQVGFALKFWNALRRGDIDFAMGELKAYLAGIPYVEGFKQKLAEAANAEEFYEYTMYLIFSMLNVYARTQVKCSAGRIVMVVWMPDTTYVFEFKVGGTAHDALEQINSHGYALPYHTDGRKVVKVGVKCDVVTRTLQEWVVDE